MHAEKPFVSEPLTSGFYRWCWGYCTEQRCKLPYLAGNMDSSSITSWGPTNSTRKQARIPTLLVAAGHPAPLLTWYNLPACSPPPHPLRPGPASRLHPLTETSFYLVTHTTNCEEATLRFERGEGCLFCEREESTGRVNEISRGTVWCFGFKLLRSIFSVCDFQSILWSFLERNKQQFCLSARRDKSEILFSNQTTNSSGSSVLRSQVMFSLLR